MPDIESFDCSKKLFQNGFCFELLYDIEVAFTQKFTIYPRREQMVNAHANDCITMHF